MNNQISHHKNDRRKKMFYIYFRLFSVFDMLGIIFDICVIKAHYIRLMFVI